MTRSSSRMAAARSSTWVRTSSSRSRCSSSSCFASGLTAPSSPRRRSRRSTRADSPASSSGGSGSTASTAARPFCSASSAARVRSSASRSSACAASRSSPPARTAASRSAPACSAAHPGARLRAGRWSEGRLRRVSSAPRWTSGARTCSAGLGAGVEHVAAEALAVPLAAIASLQRRAGARMCGPHCIGCGARGHQPVALAQRMLGAFRHGGALGAGTRDVLASAPAAPARAPHARESARAADSRRLPQSAAARRTRAPRSRSGAGELPGPAGRTRPARARPARHRARRARDRPPPRARARSAATRTPRACVSASAWAASDASRRVELGRGDRGLALPQGALGGAALGGGAGALELAARSRPGPLHRSHPSGTPRRGRRRSRGRRG